ncbi:unnamed protein product, partial [Allacma fusca]
GLYLEPDLTDILGRLEDFDEL